MEIFNDTTIDFGIVTALRIERDAVLERLDSYEKVQEDRQIFSYYRGRLNLPNSTQAYQIALVMGLDMGNEESTLAAQALLQRWQPRNLIMVGIAGGVPGKVALGDVVVAKYCYYYELAKQTPDGEQQRGKQFPCSRLLYDRALNYDSDAWIDHIDVVCPGTDTGSSQLRFGPIASGEKVVADSERLAELRRHCPELLAVAMEGAGVALAALNHVDKPEFLEIRSVCDFADEHKNDDWQPYAANAAAAFLVSFLRSRPLQPLASNANQPIPPSSSDDKFKYDVFLSHNSQG